MFELLTHIDTLYIYINPYSSCKTLQATIIGYSDFSKLFEDDEINIPFYEVQVGFFFFFFFFW